MAKRLGENFSNYSKKQKLNDNDRTLWDDDVDDDCFGEIANKILEQNEVAFSQPSQSNTSILSSYESFGPNIKFASTQNTSFPTFIKPQNPLSNNESSKELEIKVRYLEQKCEAKEGEVSILRAQIQKIKSEVLEDQSQKQRGYIEKINAKESELKQIKGQLEFKDLEIANLKQRITEISKLNLNVHNGTNKRLCEESIDKTSKTMSPAVKQSAVKSNRNKETEKVFETTVLEDTEFPLLSKFPHDFFEGLSPEIHVVENRMNQYGKNTIPFIHKQEEFILPSGPRVTVKIDKNEVSIEYIYPDMMEIIKSSVDQMNTEIIVKSINRILAMSIQLLQNFKIYLGLLEKNYRTEDIEQIDEMFVKERSGEGLTTKNHYEKCQIGIRAGRIMEFIGETLVYSSHLTDYIIYSKPVMYDERLLEIFPSMNDSGNKDYYLSLLNDIVRKIFYLRKTEICHYFLSAVGVLLLNIAREGFYEKIFPIFSTLTGTLLMTKPPTAVLLQLLNTMKHCSKSKDFTDFLCVKPKNKNFTTNKIKKVHYFMEDSCKFTLFVSLLNNALPKIHDEKVILEVSVNVHSLIYNIFMMNPAWMYDEQKDWCLCLKQIYQLGIEVSYKTFMMFKRNKSSQLKEVYLSVLRYSMKIFELLTFNSYNLMEKNGETSSQYREICKSLLESQNEENMIEEIEDLQNLNLFEETPTIPSSNFDLL